MSKALKVIAGAPDKPLIVGEIEIPCYVLEDETRVLTQSGMFTGLGLARRGLVPTQTGARLPRFAASKAINPFISNELASGLTNPILFNAGGRDAYGFSATILPEICRAVLDARRAGTLDPQQAALADRCEILVQGLATVGIIALVDEATGYQEIRAKRLLANILQEFLATELQPWKKTYPLEFYLQICRLRGWPLEYAIKRPSIVARYTDDAIYERVAPGVLDEVRRLNPVQESGHRKWKHHQWFRPDPGYVKLNQHIAAIMALMRAAPNWTGYQRNLKRAFPKLRDQLDLPLEDGE